MVDLTDLLLLHTPRVQVLMLLVEARVLAGEETPHLRLYKLVSNHHGKERGFHPVLMVQFSVQFGPFKGLFELTIMIGIVYFLSEFYRWV